MTAIKSKNLVMKEIEEKDLDLLMRWRNSPEVSDFLFTDKTYTNKSQKKWFNKNKDNKENIYFVAENLNGNKFGEARINNIDFKNKKCEIGAYIGEKTFKGKGLGKEIFKALTSFCLKELNMNKTFLKAFLFNKIAIHIYESLGFKSEGILRQEVLKKGKFEDVIVMSILRSEWKS